MTAVGEVRLPELDGARCVHAAIETASCRACVDICPKNVWRLDDAALEFDSGQCDGCGLCVPACPRQAIDLPLALTSRPVAGTNAMLAACDQAGSDAASQDKPGHIPCLHAIGLAGLLRAYREGQHVWLLAHGDCARCPRGQGEKLSTRLAHLNAALRQRGRRPIVLREVMLASWTALIDTTGAAEAHARRGFFLALSQRPAAALLGENSLSDQEKKPPGEYLPDGDDALMPWVIRLNASRCVGCHACSRVCPEAAIQFDAATPAYRLRHRACTGCGLCLDVCELHAVTLQPWSEPTQWTLPLMEQRCPCCGVAFHTPAEVSVDTRLCWICANANQKQKRRLYQVMA
jgi:ferredoxin